MTNIHYPKCPYCGTMFRQQRPFEYALMWLATDGRIKEQRVKCSDCESEYLITLTLMYYGKKIKEGKQG